MLPDVRTMDKKMHCNRLLLLDLLIILMIVIILVGINDHS